MNKYFFILAGLIVVFVPISASAQHTNILISKDNNPNETSIIIDPKDTNRMVGGANLNNFYYSSDAGSHWQQGRLSSSYGVWGDPAVMVDTTGAFYFFHLSNPSAGHWIDRIVSQKSTDGGKTWSDGSYFGLTPTATGAKAQDKHWITVDRKTNTIYATWTQFDKYGSPNPQDSSIIRFCKSTDGGINWSTPVRINEISGDCIDGDNTVEGAVPAVGPDGQVYVCWAGPLGLVFDRSLDGGKTWLEHDTFVANFPGGWDYDIPDIDRANGMPITICDLSDGPNRGTIYINWSDQRNGSDDTDIWLIKSTDGGISWGKPKRVNDDPIGKHQFFTWMAIDSVTGYLYFVFYDRRNYDDTRTDVYMAVSRDGGNSFINFKVSESPFVPTPDIFFGDYTNVSAHNNIVRPIWTRLHNGERSLWTALVDVNAVTAIDDRKKEVSPSTSTISNYPNPFQGQTYLSFKLHNPAQISLKIYDVRGRVVANLINKKFYGIGEYLEHFSPAGLNLPAGSYFYVLSKGDETLRKKMIYIR